MALLFLQRAVLRPRRRQLSSVVKGAVRGFRIVHNHTTFCEGLIPALEALGDVAGDDIKTVTPGRLFTFKGKSDQFNLYVKNRTNRGFCLMSRKGRTAQEVYIVTDMIEEDLAKAIEDALGERNGKGRGKAPTRRRTIRHHFSTR
eukprot:g60.t1